MNLNDVQSRIFKEPAFRAYVNKAVVRACASVRAEVPAARARARAAAVTAQVRRIAAARRDKPYAAARPPPRRAMHSRPCVLMYCARDSHVSTYRFLRRLLYSDT